MGLEKYGGWLEETKDMEVGRERRNAVRGRWSSLTRQWRVTRTVEEHSDGGSSVWIRRGEEKVESMGRQVRWEARVRRGATVMLDKGRQRWQTGSW